MHLSGTLYAIAWAEKGRGVNHSQCVLYKMVVSCETISVKVSDFHFLSRNTGPLFSAVVYMPLLYPPSQDPEPEVAVQDKATEEVLRTCNSVVGDVEGMTKALALMQQR